MKCASTLIPNSNESGRFLSSGGFGITYKSLNIYLDFVFLLVSSNSIEINLSPARDKLTSTSSPNTDNNEDNKNNIFIKCKSWMVNRK